MKTIQTVLVPQTEEDIEIAEWVVPATFLENAQLPVYRSIKEVIEKVI